VACIATLETRMTVASAGKTRNLGTCSNPWRGGEVVASSGARLPRPDCWQTGIAGNHKCP